MPSLLEAAGMCRCAPPPDYSPGDSVLVEELCNAVARLTGDHKDFSFYRNRAKGLNPEIGKGIYNAACHRISKWYIETYAAGVSGKKKSGISRAVTKDVVFSDAEYRFSEPITEYLFDKYLIEGAPLLNGDARDFILHTAVAFKLSPASLDRILVASGFHPLHVKNIHHMAIYAVLKDLENGNLPSDTDPFSAVEEFFQEAKLLVSKKTARERQMNDNRFSAMDSAENQAFASGSTRVIRGYMAGQKDLTRDKVLAFIRNHPEVYGMRHDRLLAEHMRMVDLFSELYKQRQTRENLPYEEQRYWLFCFLNDFCKEIERKRFNEEVFGHISKNDRHPTREFMIVLWLYSFCFLFHPEVSTYNTEGSGRSFYELTPFSHSERKDHPFQAYIDAKEPGVLKVFEYLTDDSSPGSPMPGFSPARDRRFFDGNDLIAFINEKLRSYSWRSLDKRVPFDGIIESLGNLTIRWEETGKVAAHYGTQQITDFKVLTVDNVPAPLVLITKLLDNIKKLEDNSRPLQCKCYELI